MWHGGSRISASCPGFHALDDDAARLGIALDQIDRVLYLVDALAVPIAPLVAVDGPEVAIWIGPRVPDRRVIAEILLVRVGRSREKPQQLAHDRLEQHLLGREQRKAVAKVVAGLRAEDRDRAGAGAILAALTVIEDVLDEIEILLHRMMRGGSSLNGMAHRLGGRRDLLGEQPMPKRDRPCHRGTVPVIEGQALFTTFST